MKKLLLLIITLPAILSTLVACNEDDNTSWQNYKEWRDLNNAYIEEMAKKEVGGKAYYERVVPAWNSGVYVLMHYFNDRGLTAGNLVPLETSSVSVKYKGMLYNGAGFDSSYLETDSITTFTVKGVIEGWQIALQNMHVGDTAEVLIPYNIAYSYLGSGSIPPFSVLKFGIKLVDIPSYEVRP